MHLVTEKRLCPACPAPRTWKRYEHQTSETESPVAIVGTAVSSCGWEDRLHTLLLPLTQASCPTLHVICMWYLGPTAPFFSQSQSDHGVSHWGCWGSSLNVGVWMGLSCWVPKISPDLSLPVMGGGGKLLTCYIFMYSNWLYWLKFSRGTEQIEWKYKRRGLINFKRDFIRLICTVRDWMAPAWPAIDWRAGESSSCFKNLEAIWLERPMLQPQSQTYGLDLSGASLVQVCLQKLNHVEIDGCINYTSTHKGSGGHFLLESSAFCLQPTRQCHSLSELQLASVFTDPHAQCLW